MTKQQIINKYFYEENWLGIRKCKLLYNFRIKNDKLQEWFGRWIYWSYNTTWEKFYNEIKRKMKLKKEEEQKLKYANDINNFDWNFKEI